jgi:hypothetical protein
LLWSLVHYAENSDQWISQIKAKIDYITASKGSLNFSDGLTYGFDLAIVCALGGVEFAAIKELKCTWQPLRVRSDETRYISGTKRLGNPNGARALKGKQVGNAEAVAKLKATAAQRAGDLKAIVDDIRRSGIISVRGIAEELHARGIRAPRGDTWHPTAVSRLLSRLSP